jgi:formate-dependent nitrite reductase membrane component NrfD
MIAALFLAAALQANAVPADDATVASRMQSARIASAVAFVAVVVGLGLGVQSLSRHARKSEDEERLAAAFRELDEDLSKKKG